MSYLSQSMLDWIDKQKAIRGRIRGEYYIRGDIWEDFKKRADSIEADATVSNVSNDEMVYLRKLLAKPGTQEDEYRKKAEKEDRFREDLHKKITVITQTVQLIENQIHGRSMEVNEDENTEMPKGVLDVLRQKPRRIEQMTDGDREDRDRELLLTEIGNINDELQRVEGFIQAGGLKKEATPDLAAIEQSKAHDANRAEWQEVLKGFQLYRDIFQTGMDNPKTQDGLYAALGEIAQRNGISEKEALNQMDEALKTAKRSAGVVE